MGARARYVFSEEKKKPKVRAGGRFHPGADLGFQRAGELLGVRALFSGVEGTYVDIMKKIKVDSRIITNITFI